MTDKQPGGQLPLARTPFVSIRKPGMGGLVVKADPQDIQDVESPDLRNIVFDSGFVGPRQGTTLFVAAPVGETGTPTQLLKAKDSKGTTYLIAVYGVNFYLLDKVNKVWIKLTSTYTPTKSGLFYGSVSWNLGTGSDSFYFGNGVDLVMKWIPMYLTLSAPAASADTQITVSDSTLLPASGTILVGTQTPTILYNQTGAQIEFTAQPTDGQTLTLNINGTTITIHFVSVIGVTAGNVLIAGSLDDTIANLMGLLTSPGTTSATQVALSAPNQALVENFTLTETGTTAFQLAPNTSIQYLVVAGTSSPATTYYNPTNIVALSAGIGADLVAGTVVTNKIVSVPSVPKGNIFAKSMAQGGGYRLFVAGVPGDENKLYYSQAFDPTGSLGTQELFSGGSGTLTAGWMPIIDGEGGIEDVVDFGQYLGIVKSNALVQGYFVIDTTDDTIAFNVNPTIYGESIFPISSSVNITVENNLYIPTVAQGIYSYTPSSTGAQLSTTITPFSDNILPLFTSMLLSFANGRVEFYNRKLVYLCSSIPNINNLMLVFDFAWNAWTIWDNLNAVDIKEDDGNLYFLCNDDGGLYFFDSTSNQDARSGQPVGYDTYINSKRFDWGKPSNVKQQSLAMIQGYITQVTKLYVDVLFNENGSLAAATYEIDGGNTDYVQQIPLYTPGRISLGMNPIGGAQLGTIGIFRVYLDLIFGVGAHVISFKVYSQDIGANWGLTGLSANPEENEIIPSQRIIGVA